MGEQPEEVVGGRHGGGGAHVLQRLAGHGPGGTATVGFRGEADDLVEFTSSAAGRPMRKFAPTKRG